MSKGNAVQMREVYRRVTKLLFYIFGKRMFTVNTFVLGICSIVSMVVTKALLNLFIVAFTHTALGIHLGKFVIWCKSEKKLHSISRLDVFIHISPKLLMFSWTLKCFCCLNWTSEGIMDSNPHLCCGFVYLSSTPSTCCWLCSECSVRHHLHRKTFPQPICCCSSGVEMHHLYVAG